MKKTTAAAAAALTALLAALLVVVPASSAQAYPDPTCNVSVSATTIVGGQPLDVSVTSDIEADLHATFSVEVPDASAAAAPQSNSVTQASFSRAAAPSAALPAAVHSETQTAEDATRLDARFITPKVAEPTTATVDCGCDDVSRTTTVTLLPASADGDSDGGTDLSGLLPSTGGASFWLLIVGALLVVTGIAVVARRRRA